MLEKIFSTFHALNIVMQQQYREHNFKRYLELISCLLMAEQNNELLMKNHQSHLTGSKPFLEVNETFVQKTRKNQRYRYDKNKWKKRRDNPSKDNPPYHQKWRHNEPKQENNKNLHIPEDKCHMCGMHDHRSRTCRSLKHLTDLYQASPKQNAVEINFIRKDDFEGHNVYLDVFDFFKNPDKTDSVLSCGILGFICIKIFILLYFQ
jgi:hypothetical protein